MKEELLVEILIQYANELGYKWEIITNDVPRVFFDAKVITIKKEDLVLYHVLHEVVHILIGACEDTKESIARSELLAEGISIVVRDVLGFEPHTGDNHYLNFWLRKLKTTRTKFYEQNDAVIVKYAKVIAKRIRRERGTTVPFKGCKRKLAASGAFIRGSRVDNYRPGVRLCHALPDRLQRRDCTTTEGHDTPKRLFKSAHHLARIR